MSVKRTFVLLRGLGRESRHWGPFVSMLQEQSYCSKVLLCDLPGAGIFHKESGQASVPQMLEAFSKQYEAELQAHKPLNIFAFSLGGMLALEYLSKVPDLFSEFVLVNSSVGNLSSFHKRMRPSAITTLLQIAKSNDLAVKEKLILKLTSQNFRNDVEVLRSHIRIAESAPMKFTTMVQQILAAARYSGPQRLFKKRGLVLYSKKDELVDPSCSVALARLLSVKAIGHEEAGHDLVLDDPKWVLERLRDFYKTLE